MASIIKDVFNFFAEPLKKYVCDHLRYIVQAGDNVKALTRKAGILEDKRMDIEQQIRRDEEALKKPTNEVESWLKRTTDLQPTARSKQIEDDYKSRSCMLGSCSLNCFSTHSLGMRAVEELNNVQQELDFIEGVKKYTIEMPRPAVQAMSTTTVKFGLDVFKSNLNQALVFLGGGGDIITEEGPLGICGMGGVGKTTLLEHINDAILEKGPSTFGFDMVMFVTASKNCKDGNMLLKLIIKALRLPEGSNKDDVLNHLRNKNFALLLDDLWVHVDLKDVGIPLPLGVGAAANNCKRKRKLILTSRFFNVCSNIGATQFIKVECLPQDDARRLFRAHAGLKDDDAMASSELWKLANAVADECDRLPLALVATSRAMSGTGDVRVWRNAIELLQNSKISQIPGMIDPLPLLKFSYDHLAERQKECLLHCAMWPEDYKIDTHELIRCWLGHGLLGEHSTLQKACDAGYAVIDSLQKACLLESIKYHGAPQLGYATVKLHDVIRDMALWIARECGAKEMKWVVTFGENVMETFPQDQDAWRQVHKMSIFSASPVIDIQFDCPNITTLMLSRTVFEPSNLRHMRGLKYLEIGSRKIRQGTMFPIEICEMEKLEYLNIMWSAIKLFPKEVKNLTNLKFLLCRDCRISWLPDNFFPSLANLFELDLFCKYEFISQSSVIDQLVHSRQKGSSCRLKSLGINASSKMDFQNLTQLSTNYGVSIRFLHIGEMKDLISNTLHLLSAKSFGSEAMFSNMEDLVISDQHLELIVIEDEHRLHSLVSFRILDALKLENIIWEGVEPMAVFPRLRRIFIRSCRLRHVTWAASLPCLQDLELAKCDDMEELVVWDGNEGNEEENNNLRFPFPCLRQMRLTDMPKLMRFSAGELSLRLLEALRVSGCPKLESLPFNSTASCSGLRHIWGGGKWWEALQLKENVRTFLQPFFQYKG